MKYKSKTFEKFKEFRSEVDNKLGRRIKTLRSDRGSEYLTTEFLSYLKDAGIVSHRTPPGTSQHNGVSKRRNRTYMDMVRSMMGYTDLPIYLWGYTLLTAVYLQNRVPSKSVSVTPYEIWVGRQASLNHIRIWGCPAMVKKLEGDKLDTRSSKCRFVGYPSETIGYYFY